MSQEHLSNGEKRYIDDWVLSNKGERGRIAGNNMNPTVAIYELNYGKGKVISLSIFSYKLIHTMPIHLFH